MYMNLYLNGNLSEETFNKRDIKLKNDKYKILIDIFKLVITNSEIDDSDILEEEVEFDTPIYTEIKNVNTQDNTLDIYVKNVEPHTTNMVINLQMMAFVMFVKADSLYNVQMIKKK